LRTLRFKDLELARDPLDYLGFERGLDAAIGELWTALGSVETLWL